MTEKPSDPRRLSPPDLAFVGDGVYGLLARARLVRAGSRPVGDLHHLTVELVNASAQARAFDGIEGELTERERTVFRRGRNSGARPPKHADPGDYAKATGLEALFGFLYLDGEWDRLLSLFDAIYGSWEKNRYDAD